jgi:tRNA pseudouridine55 synthase
VKINGVLNLNKKTGPTSHDIVARVRRFVPAKTKVGHAGTLDPMAEGVLPICVGAATKIFPYLLDCRKTYRARMIFGRVTDTQDVTGKTLSEEEPGDISLEEGQRLLDFFKGPGVQVPPMYSALKVGGTRLHELARAGKEVERKERPIEVYGIRALEAEGRRLTFEVSCSRGTYIRSLCHDLGARHGAGGCMEALTRTVLGPFRIEDAIELDEIESLAGEGRLLEAVIPLAEALAHLPAVAVRPEAEARFRNGVPLSETDVICEEGSPPPGGKVRVFSPAGEVIAVGRVLQGGKNIRINADRVFTR